MKSVSMIKVLLALAALALTSVAMAEDAPWVIDNIVKTGSADTTEPSADGSCLQIELKLAPSAKNVPWHNFKIVDVSGDLITFETGEDRVRIQVTKWAISTNTIDKGGEQQQNT